MNFKVRKIYLFSVFFLLLSTMAFAADPSFFCKVADPGSFLYQKCPHDNQASGYYSTSAAAQIGPIGRTSQTVMQQLVIPTEKPKAARSKVVGIPRNLGATLRYENVDFDAHGSDEGADIYGATLSFMNQTDDFSYGLLVPYDYMDFNDSNIDDVQQLGGILFGKYKKMLADNAYELAFVANVDYYFATVSFDHGHDDDINSVGGGVGMSFRVNKWDQFVPSFGVSYQYQNDDTDINDHHMVRTGTNLAFFPSENMVVNAYGVWVADLTDYDQGDNDNYWDLGLEVGYNLTDTWTVSLGYKKVVDLEDFDSDQVYLGTIWKF